MPAESGIYINKESISTEVSTNPTGELKGMGLFIANKNNDIHNQVIDFLHIDDYKYNLTNKTGKNLNCNLNVFINGKQIKLLNKENGNTDYNIKFTINDTESKDIPIKLCLDNLPQGAYIANFNIVTDYDKYANENTEKVWNDSTYNYTVAIINNNGNLSIQDTNNIKVGDNYIENMPDMRQFIVNYTKSEFEAGELPQNNIEANAGSIIQVPVILGGKDTIESLLYATLDNEQILLNDSAVLRCNTERNKVSIFNVNIHVPDKIGKYELLFYSLSNFKDVDINDFGGLEFSPSYRITLISK